jgi:hypothetical protein
MHRLARALARGARRAAAPLDAAAGASSRQQLPAAGSCRSAASVVAWEARAGAAALSRLQTAGVHAACASATPSGAASAAPASSPGAEEVHLEARAHTTAHAGRPPAGAAGAARAAWRTQSSCARAVAASPARHAS